MLLVKQLHTKDRLDELPENISIQQRFLEDLQTNRITQKVGSLFVKVTEDSALQVSC